MANTVEVSKSILEWISETVELNEQNLAVLKLWKTDKKQPTFNQLEKFSNKTRIPLGYFFLDSPPTESLEILKFRTVDSVRVEKPSRDLIDTVRQMEDVQEWMREYVIASNGEEVSFVGSLKGIEDVQSLASAARETLALPENWFEQSKSVDDSFRYLRRAISDIGVIVMINGIVRSNTHRKLEIDEFRAFTLIDEYAPLIFVNSTDSKGGMLFSLLHEFMHIGIGLSSFFNAGIADSSFVDPHEAVCNAATAEILVPIAVFQEKWESAHRGLDSRIQHSASYFKCSQSVIARRALDSRFIDTVQYDDLVLQAREIAKAHPAGGGGGDYYRTQANRIDRNFLLALNTSLQEGRTLHTEAFRLTNTNLSTFEGLINRVQEERNEWKQVFG